MATATKPRTRARVEAAGKPAGQADPVEFPRRPRRETTETSRRRIWPSRCGRFRVVEARSLYGLSTVFYAMERVDLPACTWDILSRHRKRRPALAACQRRGRELAGRSSAS